MKIYNRTEPQIRFWRLVSIKSINECWLWNGEKSKKGYGRFYCYKGLPGQKQYQYAHRFSLETFISTDKTKVIDHICKNRACVNPNHLREVTQYQNTIENSNAIPAINKTKTHCIHGHKFDKENTIIRPNGNRGCRTCKRAQNLVYKEKVRMLARN